jgi:hypothetical protein
MKTAEIFVKPHAPQRPTRGLRVELDGTTLVGLWITVGFSDPAHHTEVGYSVPVSSNIIPHLQRLEGLIKKYGLLQVGASECYLREGRDNVEVGAQHLEVPTPAVNLLIFFGPALLAVERSLGLADKVKLLLALGDESPNQDCSRRSACRS